MKTTTATLIAAALLGGAVATTAPVFARGGGDHDHCAHHAAYHHGWGMDGDMDARINHMARALDLSKDQITSLRSIADKQRPQWRDIHDRMADNRRTLERLRGDDNADPSKLRAAADAQGKAIADMIVLRATTREQIDKVLTAEQLKKWHSWQKKGHMHGGWMHHGEAHS